MLTFDVSKSAVGLASYSRGCGRRTRSCSSRGRILGEKYGERDHRRHLVTADGCREPTAGGRALVPRVHRFVRRLPRLGAGLYFPGCHTLLTNRFGDVGRALGFHNMGAPSLVSLTPVAAVFVATQFIRRVAITLGAVVAFPVAALYASSGRLIRNTPDLNITDQFNVRGVERRAPRQAASGSLPHWRSSACSSSRRSSRSFHVPRGYVGTTQTYASVAFAVLLFALQGIISRWVGPCVRPLWP